MTVSTSFLPETRCPFCHENVVSGQDTQQGCPQCRAWHHRSCWEEHGGCSACPHHISGKPRIIKPHFDPKTQKWIVSKDGTLTLEEISRAIELIKTAPEFVEVYSIAKANTKGKLYLAGGRVYRSIAEALYQEPCGLKECDWDFLAEDLVSSVTIPKKWCCTYRDSYWGDVVRSPYQEKKTRSSLHLTKIKKDSSEVLHKIDLIKLSRVHGVQELIKPKFSWVQIVMPFWKPRPTLNDYFLAVPLDIQAVVFDPVHDHFLGPGIEAVLRRQVGVNNIKGVEFQAEKNEISIPEILRKKNASLGFMKSFK